VFHGGHNCVVVFSVIPPRCISERPATVSLYPGQSWKHSSAHQTTRRHNPKHQHYLKPNNTFRKVKVLYVSLGKHRAGVTKVRPARLGYAAGGHICKLCTHVTKITEFRRLGTPFTIFTLCPMGRDRSVGIATRYGLDGPGIESWWGRDFSVPVQTGPGAHPTHYKMGTGSLSRG